MGSFGELARLSGIPGSHVARGEDRPFRIEDRHPGFRVFRNNVLPYVLNGFAHVQGYENTAS